MRLFTSFLIAVAIMLVLGLIILAFMYISKKFGSDAAYFIFLAVFMLGGLTLLIYDLS